MVTLIVVEDYADWHAVVEAKGLLLINRASLHFTNPSSEQFWIRQGSKLREQISGMSFDRVEFFTGVYTADEINYALCRVRRIG